MISNLVDEAVLMSDRHLFHVRLEGHYVECLLVAASTDIETLRKRSRIYRLTLAAMILCSGF